MILPKSTKYNTLEARQLRVIWPTLPSRLPAPETLMACRDQSWFDACATHMCEDYDEQQGAKSCGIGG